MLCHDINQPLVVIYLRLLSVHKPIVLKIISCVDVFCCSIHSKCQIVGGRAAHDVPATELLTVSFLLDICPISRKIRASISAPKYRSLHSDFFSFVLRQTRAVDVHACLRPTLWHIIDSIISASCPCLDPPRAAILVYDTTSHAAQSSHCVVGGCDTFLHYAVGQPADN